MRNSPEARLKRYTARQGTPVWGKDYRPAIQATRYEAPKTSRPTILKSLRLGRDVHTLSSSETRAALLALYHPALFDLHEQRVLSPVPAPHPLQGHPYAVGLSLPNVLGTVVAADQLGAVSRHPKLSMVLGGVSTWVPVPYLGDLLLFLSDEQGPYCVNWTIKATQGDFQRRHSRPGRVQTLEPDPSAELRHQIEALHYQAADVRTQRLAGEDLDPELLHNLRELFGWLSEPDQTSPEHREVVIDVFRQGIGGAHTLHALAQQADQATDLGEWNVRRIFYKAVWERELSVDLFRPLLADCPLRAPCEDPLVRYASWFARKE